MGQADAEYRNGNRAEECRNGNKDTRQKEIETCKIKNKEC